MVNASNHSVISVNEVSNAISLVNPIIFNIIMAGIVILIGIVAGKIVERLLLKIFELIDLDKYLKRRFGLKFSLSGTIGKIASYFVYLVAIVLALNRLNITTAIITTVVILLIIVLILFLILGANDLFANFFAGLVIKVRGNIHVGDYVRFKDRVEGHVIGMNWVHIRLETGKDESVYIPNMAVFKSGIIKKKPKK